MSPQIIETLKSDGHVFAAGALAYSLGKPRTYGCHYGMRSTRALDQSVFFAGFDAAQAGELGH